MNSLEEVPFQSSLGPLQEEGAQLLTAPPDLTVPDCQQILRDTEYGFSLEKWILTGQQPAVSQAPSCPPYWLMFGSAPEARRASHGSGRETQAPGPRARSQSLNLQQHPRAVRFLVPDDTEDEEGYFEDNEGSSAEDSSSHHPVRGRDPLRRPASSRETLYRVKEEMHSHSLRQPVSPLGLRAKRGTSPSCHDCGQLLMIPGQQQQRSQQCGSRVSKKRQRSLSSVGRKPSPSRQQRPSSAGPAVRYHRQALRTGGSRGLFSDSAAELLSALSLEERELLETVTERGYPLRTAFVALQKTGYRSPQKILKYLAARERLCELGYQEAQVEEALEMFQNCESKAAEFLHLLTQFNEMGFQQSAIKEVLLVNDNHRERALEELMTRMA